MAPLVDRGVDRRHFLKYTGCAVGGFALTTGATAAAAEDKPNTHNMLVVGERAVFLSHLPMFHDVNTAKSAFVSPHRFQVIVEARFTRAGKDVSDLYVKSRQAHPQTAIYTLSPEALVLSRLFTPAAKPAQAEFRAEVFRGHLELPGSETIGGLDDTLVKVARVVHGREFVPTAKKPAELEYILFGKGSELFLAHAIFGPPDFDHILAVKLDGPELKADALTGGVRVTVPGRKNVAAERLRAEQRTTARLRIGEGAAAQDVQIVGGREFYFEEGELLVPPTSKPTSEEQKQ